jgi:hypothetical protein
MARDGVYHPKVGKASAQTPCVCFDSASEVMMLLGLLLFGTEVGMWVIELIQRIGSSPPWVWICGVGSIFLFVLFCGGLAPARQKEVNPKTIAVAPTAVGDGSRAIVLGAGSTYNEDAGKKSEASSINADQRPWISVDVGVAGPLQRNQQGEIRATFLFRIMNVGKSPAIDVVLEPQLVLKFGDTRDEQIKVRDRMRKGPSKASGFGDVIFPNTSKD